MQEKKIERKVYETLYEATDGTEFRTKEECEKYEQTAHAVVRTKFLKLVVEEKTEWDFFGVGSDEIPTYAIKMNSQEDADIVLQLYFMENPFILKDDEYAIKRKDRAYNIVNTAYKEQDILFVGENYDGEIYLIGTRASIIKQLQDIDKPKEEVKDAK
jgi:hypothetical protein